jgi:hypothetical protein
MELLRLNQKPAKFHLDLPAPHSAGQAAIIKSPNNAAVFAGRRYGKTEAGVMRIIERSMASPGLYWWVGLSWRSASLKRAWTALKHYATVAWSKYGDAPQHYIKEQAKEIFWPWGAELWLRSADNPESLAGEGILGVVGDEFTLWRERVWTEYLEATLLDYGGWALLFGVPKGRNWASNLWQSATKREGWEQFQFTTYDSPLIKRERIDEIKRNIPEMLFRQEYLAEVVDDAGGVFRGVMAAATAEALDGPQPGGQYIAGVDVAALVDFTVVSVFDVKSRTQVYMDRFNRVDYPMLEERLAAVYKRFNLDAMTIEDNSIGQGVFDHLRQRGLTVLGFHTSATTKHAIISQLASAFEHNEITILPDPVQVGELQAYQGQRNASGGWKYGAPEGMHDDTVMAMAIAWQGISRKPQTLPEQPTHESTWNIDKRSGGWKRF